MPRTKEKTFTIQELFPEWWERGRQGEGQGTDTGCRLLCGRMYPNDSAPDTGPGDRRL